MWTATHYGQKLIKNRCKIFTMVYSSYPRINQPDREEVHAMKIAAETYSTENSGKAPSHNQVHNHAARNRYVVVAVLLALVYLLSSWSPAETETTSLHLGSGFLLFWIMGGVITLAIVMVFAKGIR